MIRLSPEAEAQVDRLIEHYSALGRVRAAENLLDALERAKEQIANTPQSCLLAPRPYPRLTQPGRLWIKAGALLDCLAYRTNPDNCRCLLRDGEYSRPSLGHRLIIRRAALGVASNGNAVASSRLSTSRSSRSTPKGKRGSPLLTAERKTRNWLI